MGRKSRRVRFQTKKVGPPRTCGQPARATAEMRRLGEAGGGGEAGMGVEARKWRRGGARGTGEAPVPMGWKRLIWARHGTPTGPAAPSSTPQDRTSESEGDCVAVTAAK